MNQNAPLSLPLISDPEYQPTLAKIKLLCCDLDGVMTDGGLYYDKDGQTMVKFCVLDGQGLKRLQAAGVKTCLITQGRFGAASKRAEVLGMDFCLTGIEDKAAAVRDILTAEGLEFSEVAHIADDVNDLTLLTEVGVAVAVPNAMPPVFAACDFVTEKSGGLGAVRELCEAIIASRTD